MEKKIFYVSLVALLLLCAAAPALASQPKLTYSFGAIGYPDSANPGSSFTTGDILHQRDIGGKGVTTGSPWGNLNTVTTKNVELNIVSLTGTGISHYVNSNDRATIEGIQNFELNGLTPATTLFIYHGPTFTATTKSGPQTVSDGKAFFGLLISGTGVAHGIADGKDVQIRVTFTGVSISASSSSAFAGDSISYGTVTYWYIGN